MHNSMILLFCVLAMTSAAASAKDDEVTTKPTTAPSARAARAPGLPRDEFPLWPKVAPGALGTARKDVPTLTPFFAPPTKATGSGLGLGLPGARRLMDHMTVRSTPGHGTVIEMWKWLPNSA